MLAFFMAAQIFYLVMILNTLPHLQELAGGLSPFDMLPTGYDSDYAMAFLTAIGADGRTYYLTRQLPLDMIYPGLFAISYAIIWRWFLAKATGLPALFGAVMFLPLLAGLSDYLENGLIFTMLTDFPDLSQSLVRAASAVTMTKAALTSVYFVALIGLLAVLGVQKFRAAKP